MHVRSRVVIVDNYDSFTYNLYQYISQLATDVEVVRNDKTDIDQLRRRGAGYLVISPGPKAPASAGVSIDAINMLGEQVPVLGVCLGHQCINEAFGGRTIRAPRGVHGKTSLVRNDGSGIFSGLPSAFSVARYHSLVADPDALGDDLMVTARTDDGVIMGLRHRRWPIEGLQFHPESFMTECGMQLLVNFFRNY
jgi:anthranilate synthase/aminodeoxychorismate synthase-like glutamine amidotransferase